MNMLSTLITYLQICLLQLTPSYLDYHFPFPIWLYASIHIQVKLFPIRNIPIGHLFNILSCLVYMFLFFSKIVAKIEHVYFPPTLFWTHQKQVEIPIMSILCSGIVHTINLQIVISDKSSYFSNDSLFTIDFCALKIKPYLPDLSPKAINFY